MPAKYPIFPIRLRPDDRHLEERLKHRYGVSTLSDVVRLSLRIVHMLNLPLHEIRGLLAAYQEENPDAEPIKLEELSDHRASK